MESGNRGGQLIHFPYSATWEAIATTAGERRRLFRLSATRSVVTSWGGSVAPHEASIEYTHRGRVFCRRESAGTISRNSGKPQRAFSGHAVEWFQMKGARSAGPARALTSISLEKKGEI